MSTIIKGGEAAIDASHRRLAEQRRGDLGVAPISISQIEQQLGLGIDRVMAEGGLFDRRLAAIAIKQSQCDLAEAIFLVRAFRTTLRGFGAAEPIDSSVMHLRRRVSTIYKEPVGGQFLGPTYDYTYRLIDFSLEDEADAACSEASPAPDAVSDDVRQRCETAFTSLVDEDVLESAPAPLDCSERAADLNHEALGFPANRDLRLQALARADEGFLLGLAYSSMRGFGNTDAFVADLRVGDVCVEFVVPEVGFAITLCELTITECQTLHRRGNVPGAAPQFTRGYALIFGQSERKAIAAAMLDRTLRAQELGEEALHPAQDEEFVLAHADNVASAGMIQHLKLPHYVNFQAQLRMMRELRDRFDQQRAESNS